MEEYLYQLAVSAAKERNGSVIIFDINNLSAAECELLLDMLRAGRLKIETPSAGTPPTI